MNLSALRSFCIRSNKELKKSMLFERLIGEKLEILVKSPLPSATTFRFNNFKTRLIRLPFTLFFL